MNNYNPNTKYGRNKSREDLNRRYNNMSKKEKDSFDSDVGWAKFILFVIAIIVLLACVIFGITVK
jgi:hypothetical protein